MRPTPTATPTCAPGEATTEAEVLQLDAGAKPASLGLPASDLLRFHISYVQGHARADEAKGVAQALRFRGLDGAIDGDSLNVSKVAEASAPSGPPKDTHVFAALLIPNPTDPAKPLLATDVLRADATATLNQVAESSGRAIAAGKEDPNTATVLFDPVGGGPLAEITLAEAVTKTRVDPNGASGTAETKAARVSVNLGDLKIHMREMQARSTSSCACGVRPASEQQWKVAELVISDATGPIFTLLDVPPTIIPESGIVIEIPPRLTDGGQAPAVVIAIGERMAGAISVITVRLSAHDGVSSGPQDRLLRIGYAASDCEPR